MVRHSISIITEQRDEFKELTCFEDVKKIVEMLKGDYKVLISKMNETNGSFTFYLTPFVTKNQIINFEPDDQIIHLKLPNTDLFHILSKRRPQPLLHLKDGPTFLSQEPIGIESVRLRVSNSEIILPNCPICINRLDKSISGLSTIKCRDMFHSCCQDNCKMLSKECPVCQVIYELSPSKGCSDCESTENLWICLICANLGCGRYKGGHAHNHFIATGHSFVLKLDSHHIWDYSLDKYVHWSIKGDGGTMLHVNEDLKPFSENNSANSTAQTRDTFVNDFTSAQLESQKAYFEERLRVIKTEHNLDISDSKREQEEKIQKMNIELNRLNHERKIYSDLSGKLQEQVKKLQIITTTLTNELETEKKISQGLAENIDHLQTDSAAASKEREDLQEQVKDLMKHIEILDLMGQAGNNPEIVQGKLFIRHQQKKKSSQPK